jgi:enoyl-CoA hydratase
VTNGGPPGPATDPVLVTPSGPVTVVTINRPERRNAVDGSTARLLLEAFEHFDGDDAARVAVLTGAGDTFCAGADLKAFSEGEPRPIRQEGRGPMGPTRLVTSKPVLAAVEGFAVAGGLELAIWCDLRVMAADAVFGVFCRRFGIPLVDGGTVRLPRLIGQSRALDLVLTGREVGAEEALHMGLANRVVPSGQALEGAVALAHELAALPQACLRNDRLSLLGQWGLSEFDALMAETRFGLDSLSSPEAIEGAARFASGAGRGGATVDPPPGEPSGRPPS